MQIDLKGTDAAKVIADPSASDTKDPLCAGLGKDEDIPPPPPRMTLVQPALSLTTVFAKDPSQVAPEGANQVPPEGGQSLHASSHRRVS